MALFTTVMEEITAYTGLSPAAFFTVVVLVVALYRTVCGMFVANLLWPETPTILVILLHSRSTWEK
jgi:membrane-associated progesterone receptor component